MMLQNKIEQYLEIIRELDKTFCEAQGKEILPLSFFSSSIDILNRLKTGVYEIEALQLQMMQEHIKKAENEENEMNEIKEVDEVKGINKVKETVDFSELRAPEEKPTPAVNVLADTIGRKISADFGKSLSLNDRFMFQRDFFQGNASEMNQAFSQLNEFQSLNETLEFFNEKYAIVWDSDSGIILKELLDKRFA